MVDDSSASDGDWLDAHQFDPEQRRHLEHQTQALAGRWWHSVDLGEGVVTPGAKSPEVLAAEWQSLQLPDLHGKTVLDIGAWDGFFSFEAERRGAKRVVALDHFMWSINLDEMHGYHERCAQQGVAPLPYDQVPELWDPQGLPGKACFDTARRAVGSGVESFVADFMTTDLDELGTFDVVLYLGVLYHMKEPLTALERVAQVTREVAAIETEAVAVPGYEHVSLCEFFPADELGTDPTNWWAPNARALVGLCRAAGFPRVDTSFDEASLAAMQPGRSHRYRTVVQAWKQ